MKARRAGVLPLLKNRIGPIRVDLDESLGHYIRMMKTGEFEFEAVSAMRCFLRPGDVFLDIGANLGYLSAWGMRLVTPAGRVLAVEPTVAMADRLDALGHMNPDYQLDIHRVAAGETPQEAEIVLAGDGMQGSTSLVREIIPDEIVLGQELVRVVRLDDYMDARDAESITLVKIDVEGYEFSALKGMEGWFRRGFSAPIICELSPHAYAAQGFALSTIVEYLASWGYTPCRLSDFSPIDETALPRLGRVFNVIFIKQQ
ncbi:MAG: FkbM family methyltransferase [Kiritimatiellae bacterium]|nr:FkbM family methyltransferase [Kiritimatiellia bacterium]